jgi:flagellar biosynthesis anti-sigma factor FlgM
MSIDRVNISSQGLDRSQGTQDLEALRNARKDRQTSSSGSDSVALSSQAREMDRLASSIEDSRAEHLNKIRQALESGSYRVSAQDIARKLIDANRT